MKKSHKKIIGAGVVITIIILVIAGVQTQLGPGDLDDEPVLLVSDFKGISWVDREDVSANLPLEIYTLDPDKFEDTGYIYEELTKFSNWDKQKSGDADDITIDLSNEPYVLIRVDVDDETVFEHYDMILPAGANSHYEVFGYHMSSDVNHIMLNDAMSSITLGNFSTNGNYTQYFNFPDYNTDDAHYGPKWEKSTSDFNDLSQSEKEDYWYEPDWRSQPFLYNIENDEDHDFDDPLERGTNAFGFVYVFNVSLNVTDGSAYQVNWTLSSEYSIEKIISGNSIYAIFTETFHLKDGAGKIKVESQFASLVGLNEIKSVRFNIPKNEDSISISQTFSSMGV